MVEFQIFFVAIHPLCNFASCYQTYYLKMNIKHCFRLIAASVFFGFTAAHAQLPSITGISPMSSDTGIAVVITGSNFNTTPDSNIVYFGATRANVVAATTTVLNVTVPSEATFALVSVNNLTSGLTGFSDLPFLPAYNNSGYVVAGINFSQRFHLAASLDAYEVAIGDLDGDGNADIVTANEGIRVYHNISTGFISLAAFLPDDFSTYYPRGLALADMDGDGKLDVIYTNPALYTAGIMRNTSTPGTINLSGGYTFSLNNIPQRIAVGDIDGDGLPDVAVIYNSTDTVSVYHNTSTPGSLSFGPRINLVAPASPSGITIGDIDGDGKPEIVVTSTGTSLVSVFPNISVTGAITTGSFATRMDLTVGTSPLRVAIADMDGDGKADLVVSNNGSNNLSVLQGTSTPGAISFAAPVTLTSGTAPVNLALGDINGDGKPDIVCTNNGSNTVSAFRNTSIPGTVSFAPKADFPTDRGPYAVALGDVNVDGMPDIVVTTTDTNTICILRNNPVNGISGPNHICVGSSLSLSETFPGGTWNSSNSAIATVGAGTGYLTGISKGTAVISYSVNGIIAMDTIKVDRLPLPVIIQTGNVLSTTVPFPSYQWFYATGALSGATNATYTIGFNNAFFDVVVTDGNGCSNTSNFIYFTAVQNITQTAADIKVYPDPASAVVNIESPVEVNLILTSLDGRVLISKKSVKEIEISKLPPGEYLLNIYDSDSQLKVKTAKVVKVGN